MSFGRFLIDVAFVRERLLSLVSLSDHSTLRFKPFEKIKIKISHFRLKRNYSLPRVRVATGPSSNPTQRVASKDAKLLELSFI